MPDLTQDVSPLQPVSSDHPALAGFVREPFTPEETQVLSRFFTNLDLPVFGLVGMPQVVAGALFARYSRTHKSLRRLFLDEFVGFGSGPSEDAIDAIAAQLAASSDVDVLSALRRAEQLYERVFLGFGDDSVAQLGGAHVACEQVSNLLSKQLEWGRLASYLEQSTRYIRYDDRVGFADGSSGFRYHVPDEVRAAGLESDFRAGMDALFVTYSEIVQALEGFYASQPRPAGLSDAAWRGLVRSQACDAARGLLPAATRSNLGIFASGQAYEQLLLRLQSSRLSEARLFGGMLLGELRKMIPSFLSRVDREDRGVAWSRYLAGIRDRTGEVAAELARRHLPEGFDPAACDVVDPSSGDSVRLVWWDPDAERKITEALLFQSGLSQAAAERVAERMSEAEVDALWRAAVGERLNRRHKPSRAFEEALYRVEVVSDYGAFRDLQRHRMMSIHWHTLDCRSGFSVPEPVVEVGLSDAYTEAMDEAAGLSRAVEAATSADVAAYAVPFGYRLRYSMTFNARQAFHMLELRSQPNGHPSYRRVAGLIFSQIRDVAGHRRIAEAMSHVNTDLLTSGRLDEARRNSR